MAMENERETLRCRCQREIRYPRADCIFCPYCGMRHIVPCESVACQTSLSPGQIVLLESPLCKECGAIYRFASDSPGGGVPREAILPCLLDPTIPQGEEERCRTYVDLLPASGNPSAFHALRANYQPYPISQVAQEEVAIMGGTPIRLAESCHGMLYLLSEQGALYALDTESLDYASKWQNISLLGHGEEFRRQDTVKMLTHGALLLVLHNTHLYGFHAGTAQLYFESKLRGVTPEHMIALDQFLLVLGTNEDRAEIFQIYDLADLCLGGGQFAPRETHILSENPPARTENLPAQRLAVTSKYFVILGRQGSIFRYDPSTDILFSLFNSQNGARRVRQWTVHEEMLYVVLAKRTVDQRGKSLLVRESLYSRPIFPLVNFHEAMPIEMDWELDKHPTAPLFFGEHLFAVKFVPKNERKRDPIDTIEIIRVSRENPNLILDTCGVVRGLEPTKPVEWLLVPNGGYPYLLVYVQVKERHTFCQIPLYRFAEGGYVGPRPSDAYEMQMLYSDRYALFLNRTQGRLWHHPLPPT